MKFYSAGYEGWYSSGEPVFDLYYWWTETDMVHQSGVCNAAVNIPTSGEWSKSPCGLRDRHAVTEYIITSTEGTSTIITLWLDHLVERNTQDNSR